MFKFKKKHLTKVIAIRDYKPYMQYILFKHKKKTLCRRLNKLFSFESLHEIR